MIKYNEIYLINDGQESIVFNESKVNTISGKYNSGTLTGSLVGNILKATYHNHKINGVGLIEIEFNENDFNGKWKQGLEPGPMKGKWKGVLQNSSQDTISSFNNSTQEFVNYIKSDFSLSSAYEGVIESTNDFVEDFSIEFEDDIFFGDLNNELDVVVFRVDNSEYSIDERDGNDSYTMFYDFKNNCIYKQDPNEDDEYYCFLKSWHASIPNNYKENKKFLGCYSMSDLNQKWTVSFQGDYESVRGDLDDKILNKIKSKINSSSFYSFLSEVLDCM
jgi:hypothetical protein